MEINDINKKLSPSIIKVLTSGEFLSSNHIDRVYRDYYNEVKNKSAQYHDIMEISGFYLIEKEKFFYAVPIDILSKKDRIKRNIDLLNAYLVVAEHRNGADSEIRPGMFIYKAQIEDAVNNHNDGLVDALINFKGDARGDLSGKTNGWKIDNVLAYLRRSRFIELCNEERQEYVILSAWDFIVSLERQIEIIKQTYLNRKDNRTDTNYTA